MYNPNGIEIRVLDATKGISDKVTPDTDFTDEAVVKCDVPVVKILL